jgi:hypothetical protein
VNRPTAARLAVGAPGVLAGAYGGYLLLTRQDASDHVATAAWLVAGVVLHDGVLAPLSIALVGLGARLLPTAARAPVVVGLVVLGAVTLLAIPVLGRFGAKPDNPTLLDRAYGPGWAVLAGLCLLVVLLATALRVRASRHATPPADTPGPLRESNTCSG